MSDNTVIRGDTTLWTIPLVDANDDPYDLTNCAVWVTVKTTTDEGDEEALYQHILAVDGTGTAIVSEGLSLGGDAEEGVVVQELTPAESVAFEAGNYIYDVQVMLANGRIYTPILGASEVVVEDITRDITRPEDV
jgi:hypothetical protein